MSLRLPWTLCPLKINDITPGLAALFGPKECEARCKLATAYRLTHFFGWDEMVYGHITLRIPDSDKLLINPFGKHHFSAESISGAMDNVS